MRKKETKTLRTIEDFYNIEKEETGALWKDLQKGLPVLERRYASYAYKRLVEEMTGTTLIDMQVEHLKAVPTEYIKGLLLSVTNKAESTLLLSGLDLKAPEKLWKKARHAGRVYACAVDEYLNRIDYQKASLSDLTKTYTSKDRDAMLVRALAVAKTIDIQNTEAGDLAYRNLVVALLPQSTYRLYMEHPSKPLSDEDCDIALERARHCGSSYVEYVTKYIEVYDKDVKFVPDFYMWVENPIKAGYESFEERLYAHDVRKSMVSTFSGSGITYNPALTTIDGIWVHITQDMRVVFPSYTATLERLLKTLDEYKIEFSMESSEKNEEHCNINILDTYGATIGTIHLSKAGTQARTKTRAERLYLESIIDGKPIELPEEEQESIPEGLAEDLEEMKQAIRDARCYAKVSQSGSVITIAVEDDYDEYGTITLSEDDGFTYHITDRDIMKTIRRHMYMAGY